MAPLTDLDRLVARAQRGDSSALEAVCARARPLLVRHARRLLGGGRAADVEDAVQEVLILVCARIGTYRWEGSFAGWLYAVATRSILRHAAAGPREASLAAELADRALVSDHDPMTEAEWHLVEQDVNLACTVGVLTELTPETRRLYLLGEVLAVPDTVGAQVAQVTPAAYRKRLERARRAVAAAVRAHARPAAGDDRIASASRELDDLLRLGELHRAHARPGDPAGALRALERVAPTLAAIR
ncbi:MAG TPA: sigma-70 family RNA polymerase sigma factor [Thermoleophilaceae bacterium]|jgi:RNA polymerase sigma factor (sigma-70 family)